MNPFEIEIAIREYTAQNGGSEIRHYLGMSGIGGNETKLLNKMLNGSDAPTLEDAQRLALGYETENNVRARLEGAGLIRTQLSDRELHADWSLYQGEYLFRGHTDGEWMDGSLLEIKSTIDAKIAKIEKDGVMPHFNYWQVQAYMHYGGYGQANVLYFARDTGRILVRRVLYDRGIGNAIDQKARRIINAYHEATS